MQPEVRVGFAEAVIDPAGPDCPLQRWDRERLVEVEQDGRGVRKGHRGNPDLGRADKVAHVELGARGWRRVAWNAAQSKSKGYPPR